MRRAHSVIEARICREHRPTEFFDLANLVPSLSSAVQTLHFFCGKNKLAGFFLVLSLVSCAQADPDEVITNFTQADSNIGERLFLETRFAQFFSPIRVVTRTSNWSPTIRSWAFWKPLPAGFRTFCRNGLRRHELPSMPSGGRGRLRPLWKQYFRQSDLC